MNFKREFQTAVAVCQTTIAVKTDEPPDALHAMSDAVLKLGWEMRIWDKFRGVYAGDDDNEKDEEKGKRHARSRSAENALSSLGGSGTTLNTTTLLAEITKLYNEPKKIVSGRDVPVILVVRNFQAASDRADELFAAIQNLAEKGKKTLKFLVLMLSGEAKLPVLISPLFFTIEHELPDETELGDILGAIELGGKPLEITEEHRRAAIKAALGLNRMQAESVFSMAALRDGAMKPATVWNYKVKQLNDDGLIEIYQGGERFSEVGGLQGAKDFLIKLLRYDDFDRDDPAVRAKGITMLGPPGVGKTLLSKCLGNETGRPVVMIDIGKLMGGLVGETEARTRRLFQVLRRLAPLIAICDEFGKQMPSTTNKSTDSGVSARLAGAFLKEMNDIQEDIFWTFCENDISHVDRGFTRAERIDAIIYVRLPGAEQRATCWRIYFNKFFPAVIGKKTYPHHIELDANKLLEQYKALTTKNPAAWGHKLAPAVMCLAGDARKKAKADILAADSKLASAVEAAIIDDGDWTPAEICACVRLMRRLKMTLADTQHVIGHVVKGDFERIQKIEDWCCTNGALDAETGKLFQLTVEERKSVEETKRTRRRNIIENADPDAN